ncbi:MAG TPA: enoyl-CoA hydratase-related protein [Candidatus Binataceae bacterium]|nr:enoyl-CoA hydratase-related protein [Candidatus Binataceae bacterium]
MAYETLDVKREGQVAWLTLNRPHVLNALNSVMIEELRDFFGGLPSDSDTRVVVMRGAGRAFCAGLDLREQGESGPAGFFNADRGVPAQRHVSEIPAMMRRAPQPIIGAIHGPACGGGFSLTLATDVRIAGESARMNAAYIRIGLTGTDMGSSYFLPRLVGMSVASELLLTGRFIDAKRALAVGLVSEVVPDSELEAAARKLADDMLYTSPLGLRLTKEGLSVNADAGSLEAAMAVEDRNQLLCTSSPDFKEGIRAFQEKRRPHYGNR